MGCGSRGFFYNEKPVYREAPKEKQSFKKNEDPLEILKLRFVNGEITLEEYNKMKQILVGDESSFDQLEKPNIDNKKTGDYPKKQEPPTIKPKVSLKKS